MTENNIKYNLAYLEEISNNDESFMLDMIKTFVENTPESLAEMDLFLSQQDFKQLGKTAHRFAPNLAFMGVEIINTDLDLLEEYALEEKNTREIPFLVNEIKKNCEILIDTLKNDFKL